jgi:hypothetical protein
MDIPPTGWILLLLGIGCFLLAPESLYPLTVFFLPFSATAVVNIGSADSASGVQASMLFGTLWMLKEISSFGGRLHMSYRQLSTPVRQLGMFFMVACLSLLVPLWISGQMVIESPELGNSGSVLLQFSVKHVTQTIYLLYGILLAIFVAARNIHLSHLLQSAKIFLISALFVSLWGFFQFFCKILGIEYPAYIFNTSATESASGYAQVLRELGVSRISSVATEPSMFAQSVLIALVIALFAVIGKQPLISKAWDRFALAIILGALVLSTSTTAYGGLLFVAVLYVSALVYLRMLHARYVLPFFLVPGLLLYAYSAYPPVRAVFESMILGKGESYSALARINSVLLARDYFFQYPILGLGWGSVSSHDLVSKLLSNTGLMGLCAFSLFLLTLVTRLWRTARSVELSSAKSIQWPVCVLAMLLTLIFTNAIGDFAFSYGHVWFVFGLAISVPALGSATGLGAISTHNPNLQTRTAE